MSILRSAVPLPLILIHEVPRPKDRGHPYRTLLHLLEDSYVVTKTRCIVKNFHGSLFLNIFTMYEGVRNLDTGARGLQTFHSAMAFVQMRVANRFAVSAIILRATKVHAYPRIY